LSGLGSNAWGYVYDLSASIVEIDNLSAFKPRGFVG